MAGTISADFLQPSSNAGLYIVSPAGATMATINTSGIFSNTGVQMVTQNGVLGNISSQLITTNTVTSPSNTSLYLQSSGAGQGVVLSSNNNAVLTVSQSSFYYVSTIGSGTANTTAGLILNGSSNTGFGTYIQGQRNSSPTWYLGDTSAALGSGSGFINYVYGANPHIFYNSSIGETMRISSTGNVGIGTSSPNSQLDVRFPALTTTTQLNHILLQSLSNATNTTTGARTGITFDNRTVDYVTSSALSTSGIYGINLDTGPYGRYMGLVFYTSTIDSAATEKMRIDSVGNVGIGLTSPTSILHVTSATTSPSFLNTGSGDNRALYIENSNAGGLPNGLFFAKNTNDTNSTAYSLIQCIAGSTQRFIVYGNGQVNATGAYTNVSDVRIKKDIVDATPKLDKLLQVRVVNYTRTDHKDNIKEIGVISQELEEIFPNLISTVEEKDSDGNVTCPDRKLVKYSVFVPILIKAMQEQQAMIIELQNRLAAANIA